MWHRGYSVRLGQSLGLSKFNLLLCFFRKPDVVISIQSCCADPCQGVEMAPGKTNPYKMEVMLEGTLLLKPERSWLGSD